MKISDIDRRRLRERAAALLPTLVDLFGVNGPGRVQEIEDAIISVAENYLWAESFQINAASVAQVRNRLERLRDAAAELAGLLSQRDRTGINALSRARLLRTGAVARGEIAPGQGSDDNEETLKLGELFQADRADRIAEVVQFVFRAAANGLATLPDKSESLEGTKLWLEWSKRELVIECLVIFDRLWAGHASTTAGGEFRHFVTLAFEVATGQVDADLERPVKDVIRDWKVAKRKGLYGSHLWASL